MLKTIDVQVRKRVTQMVTETKKMTYLPAQELSPDAAYEAGIRYNADLRTYQYCDNIETNKWVEFRYSDWLDGVSPSEVKRVLVGLMALVEEAK